MRHDNKEKAFHFRKRDGLLFFADADGAERLCIPATKEVDNFQENHDDVQHLGFHRAYHRIRRPSNGRFMFPVFGMYGYSSDMS